MGNTFRSTNRVIAHLLEFDELLCGGVVERQRDWTKLDSPEVVVDGQEPTGSPMRASLKNSRWPCHLISPFERTRRT